MMNPDLKRSLKHFKKHEELEYRKLNFIHKVFLSTVFFILLPFVAINIFFNNNNKNRKKIFILEYKEKEPYATIYKLLKQEKVFNFIKLNKLFIPVLPVIFLKDVSMALKKQPIYMLKNLYFLGALGIKISKYYFLVKRYKISNLIVLQEYSFYMSYLTRVMEDKGGHLYNIQHGIPGDTYCHFRFSSCFIWGEYYKEVYINNGAEETQFVVSGSILHRDIKKNLKQKELDIDILYVMQGKSEEMKDVLAILEDLSKSQVVRYIQHPRHPVSMQDTSLETKDNILDAILRSKVIIGHYSTALLDASVLEKSVLSYTKAEKNLSQYISFLSPDNIVHTKENLIKKILEENDKLSTLNENNMNNVCNGTSIDLRYIDMKKDPVEVILNAIL